MFIHLCSVKITKLESYYIHVQYLLVYSRSISAQCMQLTLKMNPYLPTESANILMSSRPSDIKSSMHTYTSIS